MTSPTQRALAICKSRGWTAGIVERRNPKLLHVTHDFLGVFDLIACHPSLGLLAVQVTSGANHAARETKIELEPRALVWLQSGGRAEVWSFARRGPRGKTKRWTLRRTRAYIVDGRLGWILTEEHDA